MAEYKCICGKPIEFKETREYSWCDWCGERMFRSYALLSDAVRRCEAGEQVDAESIADLHVIFRVFQMAHASEGVSLDVSRELLLRAAEKLKSPLLWRQLLEDYSFDYNTTLQYAERGYDCHDPKSNEHRKQCIFIAGRLCWDRDEYKKAAEYFKQASNLDPNNSDLLFLVYVLYNAAWEESCNVEYSHFAEEFLHRAAQLGNAAAQNQLKRDQAMRERREHERNERIHREAVAEANAICDAMLARKAHELQTGGTKSSSSSKDDKDDSDSKTDYHLTDEYDGGGNYEL